MNSYKTKNFFRVSAEDFKKIPGNPITYWIGSNAINLFSRHTKIGEQIISRCGMNTGNNEIFLRFWHEISFSKIGRDFASTQEFLQSNFLYAPYNKGGSYRKWYGNIEYVIKFNKKNYLILLTQGNHLPSKQFYFLENITWSDVTSAVNGVSFRYSPIGSIFDGAAAVCFPDESLLFGLLGYLNSAFIKKISFILNPTLHFKLNDFEKLPNLFSVFAKDCFSAKECLRASKIDWDSYETSWDFQTNPLLTVGNGLNADGNQYDLSAIYIALRRDWQRQTEEMRRLEIENNRIFIDAYGLQDELSAEVSWNEITLTCNPWYRYGKNIENFDAVCNDFVLGKKDRIEILPVNNNESDERPADAFPFAKETEERLLEDTIKEFISYAVGCMMGRYSPEKPGLILANQGESIDDYHKKMGNRNENIANGILYSESTTNLAAPPYTVKECCGFSYHQIIDCDGVIPILDEEWFIDDIVAQFKSFLKFTFGMEHFADNLDFIEKALGKDIRKYFIKDFYKDHVQRYKKRPIYWMFSSPKGSFNALIYMHRYRPDTVSIVLNEYLREFISKIRSHREHLITENNRATLAPAEKTRNLKLIDKYAAMLTELDAYERDILYPLAQQKIAIDLDDGVKVNYCKFGAALKKIPGLEAKEE